MNTNKYSVVMTHYEYNILSKNSLISTLCAKPLKSAIERDDQVELMITLSELTDLIGYIAAEANHTRSINQSQALNSICDYLEVAEQNIKKSI